MPLLLGAFAAMMVAWAVVVAGTGFSPWDDEGYLMVALRSYLDGGRLFDDVFSQYGPVYFQAHAVLYRALCLEVSHDATRALTAAWCLLASGLYGLAVRRLTGSNGLGAVVALVELQLHLHLAREPGHPSVVTSAATAGVIRLLAGDGGRSRIRAAAIGLLVAAAGLTKVNVGAMLGLGVGLGYAAGRPILGPLLAAAVLTMPPLLLRADLGVPAQRMLLVPVLAALIPAVGLGMGRRSRPGRGIGDLVALVGAAAGLTATVLGATLLGGTTPAALVDGLIVRPWNFPRVFQLLREVDEAEAIWSATSVGLAAVVILRPAWSDGPRGRAILGWARLAFLGTLAWQAFGDGPAEIAFGAWTSGGGLGGWGRVDPIRAPSLVQLLPWTWLILVSPRADPGGDDRRARLGLAALGPLVALQAYPVAGTQYELAKAPLVAIAAVVGWAGLKSLRPGDRPRLDAALLLAASLALVPAVGLAVRRYQHLTAIDLPGARLVRVEAAEARTYRALVGRLACDSDAFYTEPGLNSLYFWARKRPPTGANATHWMTLFDGPAQQAVVDALAEVRRLRVVRSRRMIRFWLKGRPIPPLPIARLVDGLTVVETIGDFEILARPAATVP